MFRTTAFASLAILPAFATSACGSAEDTSRAEETAAPELTSQAHDEAGAAPIAPSLRCADLAAGLSLGGVVITRSEEAASSSVPPILPAHCVVQGQIDARTGSDGKPYAIGFELRMPLLGYSGRFFFQGGGGTDGVINPAIGDLLNTTTTNALTLGYAVVSTDGGHTGPSDVSFGLDPQARIDYGYNAVGRATEVGKAIVARYYGSAPRRSYFVGCSNGGRQGLVAASRFADQFNGIVASAPGLSLPKAALAQAWDTQQLFLAGPPGQLPRDTFPPEALSSVAAGVLARCDALDGLADGLVNDADACATTFELERDVLTCQTPDSSGCLSPAQKSALANLFAGVKNGTGTGLYASWPFDPGVSGGGWRFWKLDAGFAPLPLNTIVGASALGYIFTTPPDAPDLGDAGLGYQLGFNFDVGGPKIFATDATFTQSAWEFMTPPEPTQLERFKSRGGKLIVVHGSADPVFSAHDTLAWYRALVEADPSADSYARVFLVPGMNHCSGGPATDRFDMLAALQSWIESGSAPESVVAAVDPANPDVVAQGWPSARTRPLCPYPKRAVFTGTQADAEAASSFSCQ